MSLRKINCKGYICEINRKNGNKKHFDKKNTIRFSKIVDLLFRSIVNGKYEQ